MMAAMPTMISNSVVSSILNVSLRITCLLIKLRDQTFHGSISARRHMPLDKMAAPMKGGSAGRQRQDPQNS